MHIDSAIIWNGFHFKWEKYPHRLSLLGSRFLPILHENEKTAHYEHELIVKIGNWPPERASYSVPYCQIINPEIFIGKGTVSLYTSCPIEEGVVSNQKITLSPDSLMTVNNCANPKQGHQLTVLLNGFRIQSANNNSGWHFGGLGIQITAPKITESGDIEFNIQVFARPARSPELLTHGNKEWNYKTVCDYQFEIDIAVISAADDAMHTQSHTIHNNDNRGKKTYKNQSEIEIQGKTDLFKHAISGISGFNFKLDAHDKALFKKRTGRYVREMGFFVDGFNYNAKSGIGQVNATTIFSNDAHKASYLVKQHKLESTLDLHMIQLNGADSIERGDVSGATSRNKQHAERKIIKGLKAS